MKERFLVRLVLTCFAVFALGFFAGYYYAAKEAKVRVSIALERQ